LRRNTRRNVPEVGRRSLDRRVSSVDHSFMIVLLPVDLAPERLKAVLLPPGEARPTASRGSTDAAVLAPIFGLSDRPGIVFTERREDLRRHAGEISFPGGRPDHGEDLLACALREAREEIGLDPTEVEVLGALPPVSTVVTGYMIHPFVGLIPSGLAFQPNPAEVAAVLLLHLDELRAGFGMRRLMRRGVPIKTATYVVGEHLVWGATARILRSLFERLDERS
jgi:8-oxo-dGTP pyrophosphatase MutT (NUDIX family)